MEKDSMHLMGMPSKGCFVLLLIGLLFCFAAPLSFAQEPVRTITGKVTRVYDGETIQVTTSSKTKLKVRLYGADAPDMPKTNPPPGYVKVHGESFGKDCKEALEAKIMGKEIRMDVMAIDKNKRALGIVWLDNRNINLEMVQEGYAKAHDASLKEPYRSEFLSAQKEARSLRRGLWNLPE
jgi:micrococcal nuclease